jgi:hypothetical protein
MTNRLGRQLVAGMLALTLCAPSTASADDPFSPPATRADPTALREAVRRSLPALTEIEPAAKPLRAQGSYGKIKRNPHARTKRDIGMIIGVIGGLYAGAYIGAKIEGDSCRCDDPGFQGGLIGALTGAVLGGIAGRAIGSR